MSTLVAENRQNKLVPCEHMGTEQTAVVVLAGSPQYRCSGADEMKDGKDKELKNKEVIPKFVGRISKMKVEGRN